MTLLKTSALCVGHGSTTVARDLDLAVEPGEVVGLFGPNGAGKTTTLLTVAGILPPHRGDLHVLDGPARGARSLARAGLRLVPENRGLFRQLTVKENLVLGLPAGRGARTAMDEILTALPRLKELLSRRAGLLSGGEQQQLAMARALLGAPSLLLVDEMSLGLAPKIAGDLLHTLRARTTDTGMGVLLVEQHVPLALEIVDRAYILGHGRIRHSGTAEDLRRDPDLLTTAYLGG